MSKKSLLLLVILCLLFTFSCKKEVAPDNNVPEGPPSVGDNAVDFTETNSNGQPFTLSSLRGRVILLNISAMWCGPCQEEAAELEGLYQQYKDRGFMIVSVIYQDEDHNAADLSDIKRWVKRFGLSFVVVNDPDQSTVNSYQPSAIPLNIVIDKNFIIRYRKEGFSRSAIEACIEQYL